MSRISKLLELLEKTGIDVNRGAPASDTQIEALQVATKCRFPADYDSFLKEFGALSLGGRLTVYGIAPGDDGLSVVGASRIVAKTLDVRKHEGRGATLVAFLGTRHFPLACHAFDSDGNVHSIVCGRPEDRSDQTFEDIVVSAMARELEDFAEEKEEIALLADELARCMPELFPRALLECLRENLPERPSDPLQKRSFEEFFCDKVSRRSS